MLHLTRVINIEWEDLETLWTHSVARIYYSPGYSNHSDCYCEWNSSGCRRASYEMDVRSKSRVLLFEFQQSRGHGWFSCCFKMFFNFLVCVPFWKVNSKNYIYLLIINNSLYIYIYIYISDSSNKWKYGI